MGLKIRLYVIGIRYENIIINMSINLWSNFFNNKIFDLIIKYTNNIKWNSPSNLEPKYLEKKKFVKNFNSIFGYQSTVWLIVLR